MGKVGCETDRDKACVVAWALGCESPWGDEFTVDELTELQASQAFEQLVHFTNPDGDFKGSWEQILPLARGGELIEA